MGEQKISAIKEIFQAATLSELPDFVMRYSNDERSAVKELIRKAEKKMNAFEEEVKRTENMYTYEDEYKMFSYVCGIDEVGRGPLAGPVVAGAVILPKDFRIYELNDSKKLSEKKREELYDVIMDKAIATGIGYAGPKRIDEINILNATYEAMREAIKNLEIQPDILLNDAVTIPLISIKQIPIIKGDAKSASIAAASIIAKVTRDRLMVQYDEIMPQYGFASNKGYGAQMHIDALRKYGPSPIHRKSFIKNFID